MNCERTREYVTFDDCHILIDCVNSIHIVKNFYDEDDKYSVIIDTGQCLFIETFETMEQAKTKRYNVEVVLHWKERMV